MASAQWYARVRDEEFGRILIHPSGRPWPVNQARFRRTRSRSTWTNGPNSCTRSTRARGGHARSPGAQTGLITRVPLSDGLVLPTEGSSNSAYAQLGNVRIIKGFEYCAAHFYNPLKPLTPVEGAEHRLRVEHDGASRALTEINGPMSH